MGTRAGKRQGGWGKASAKAAFMMAGAAASAWAVGGTSAGAGEDGSAGGEGAATAGNSRGTNTIIIQQSGPGHGGASVTIEGLSVNNGGNRGGAPSSGPSSGHQGSTLRVINGTVFLDGQPVPDDARSVRASDGTVFFIHRQDGRVIVTTGQDSRP